MEQKSFSENGGEPRRRNRVATSALLLPLLLAAIVLTSFFIYTGRIRTNEQRLCHSIGVAASKDVERSLALLVEQGQTLSEALSRNSSLGKDEVASISKRILTAVPAVTGVSTAPNAIIKFHFPEDDNDSVIGHDLLSNPDRSYALTLAAQTKAPVISGPYESVDNSGRIFFVRYPVYVGQTLWGFTSLTVDYERWYKALGLEESFPDILFGISRQQDDFSGSSDIKPALGNALVQEIPVQGGAVWQLQVKPKSGWSAFDPLSLILLISGLLASVLLYLTLSGSQKRLTMRAARASTGDVPNTDNRNVPAEEERGPIPKAPKSEAMARGSHNLVEEIVAAVATTAVPGKKPVAQSAAGGGDDIERSPSLLTSTQSSSQESGERSIDVVKPTEGSAAEVPEFKGPDVRGEVFMPEAPVEDNFAARLKRMTGQAAPLVSAPLASAPFVSAVSEESSPEPVADQDDKPIHEPVQASSESTIAPQAASEKPRSSSGKKREQNPREENLKQESLFPLDDTAEGNVAEEKVATVRVTPARAEANEPLRAEPRELPPQPPKEERSSPKRRLLSILVVDDSEANRDIMDHMIKSYGHKLDLAASGEDALALCKTQSYDIVFMDCFMPGLDGYKTTQEIRSESSSADARIIGMSARLGEQELRRCLDAGMDDLLAKPFTLKEVGEIIQKYASSPAPR